MEASWEEIREQIKQNGYWELYEYYCGQLTADDFMFASSLHGIAHTRRVLLHLLTLAGKLHLNDDDLNLLCLISIYHDTGRLHDGYDLVHGIRSHEHIGQRPLVLKLSVEDKKVFQFVVENHCLSDAIGIDKAEKIDFTEPVRAIELLKIFKDCDGLDRVRINDLSLKHLRHPESAELAQNAWILLEAIE